MTRIRQAAYRCRLMLHVLDNVSFIEYSFWVYHCLVLAGRGRRNVTSAGCMDSISCAVTRTVSINSRVIHAWLGLSATGRTTVTAGQHASGCQVPVLTMTPRYTGRLHTLYSICSQLTIGQLSFLYTTMQCSAAHCSQNNRINILRGLEGCFTKREFRSGTQKGPTNYKCFWRIF